MKIRYFLVLALLAIILTPLVSAQRIRVDMVNQDPDPVRAGDVVEVRLKLENTWSDTKEVVKIEIVPDYPFTLYQSSSIKDVGRLEGKQESSEAVLVDFKLRVDPAAKDGKNELKVNVYEGYTKWKIEDKFFINVENEKIAIQPYIVSSDLVTSASKGTITIEIANTGNNNIERLQLKLLPSEDYKLLSTSDYIYLGDLEIDDTESENFDIYAIEGKQIVKIPIQLNYQVNKIDREDKFDLQLSLLTRKEAIKLGVIKVSYTPYITGAIILIIIVFFIVRRIRKK